MITDSNDWRLQGQEKFLKGVPLTLKTYSKPREGWDHDHCEFCSTKFMEKGMADVLHEGYATEDNYRWVCTQCFQDFKDMFEWGLASEKNNAEPQKGADGQSATAVSSKAE